MRSLAFPIESYSKRITYGKIQKRDISLRDIQNVMKIGERCAQSKVLLKGHVQIL